MRRLAGIALALGLSALPLILAAQTPEAASVPPVAIVTLDQEQLFAGTLYGQAVQAQFDAEAAALLAENRKIDAALGRRAGFDRSARHHEPRDLPPAGGGL